VRWRAVPELQQPLVSKAGQLVDALVADLDQLQPAAGIAVLLDDNFAALLAFGWVERRPRSGGRGGAFGGLLLAAAAAAGQTEGREPAAGDHGVRVPAKDHVGSGGDGLIRRCARLADGVAGDLAGKAGAKNDLAGDVGSLDRGDHIPEDDFLNCLRIDTGALDQFSDDDLAEIERMQNELRADSGNIILMPEGTTASLLHERALWIAEICKER